ncbi:hypothetical protein [Streptomyces hesseae]|uniref:Uncharacterized protein n=1 Tax=Streptomyces hesseae TaxID=3075519 RepID=A0ABU2SJT8_9ACTN|nr:hypothetical protein [Streptomyces sp. DSM 40473]MDT0449247.1 hypothetical protein [Streptomyces sp. DSM 40473]
MTARTRHARTLPETDELYLRLSRFQVTALDPFTPVTAEQALSHFRAARWSGSDGPAAHPLSGGRHRIRPLYERPFST